MRGGGEYGEPTIELAASLAARNTPVTPEERDQLRALLEAMDMPTDPSGSSTCRARPGARRRPWYGCVAAN